jgi:lipopolysaccharide exporter
MMVRLLSRIVNPKGELFASTFTYGLTAIIKLGSSLILTRLLSPEVYGVFGILLSILFITELVSDVGTVALLVRHARGNEVKFIHTVWTVRLIRCAVNFSILFLTAPIIAHIYQTPILTNPLRILSLQFLLSGFESMSFILAQRDRKARISNYADLASNVVMSAFVIGVASILKSQYALIYGVLLQRALLVISSHFFYRHVGVGIAFDREAIKDQFQFARVVLPSSLLTIVLSQYDKLVLLKLSNLSLLGVYALAGNMIGPITGVIMHNARVVLYARCAEYFRSDSATATARYYAENKNLLMVGVMLPALLAGFAQLIVAILYDIRYVMTGSILMIMGLGGIILAFQNASENLLVASGRNYVVLVANIVRLCTIIPGTLLGYYLFGFYGFLWFNLAATVAVLLYFVYEQKKAGFLNLMEESRRLGAALVVFVVSLALGHLILRWIPAGWLHLGLKHRWACRSWNLSGIRLMLVLIYRSNRSGASGNCRACSFLVSRVAASKISEWHHNVRSLDEARTRVARASRFRFHSRARRYVTRTQRISDWSRHCRRIDSSG